MTSRPRSIASLSSRRVNRIHKRHAASGMSFVTFLCFLGSCYSHDPRLMIKYLRSRKGDTAMKRLLGLGAAVAVLIAAAAISSSKTPTPAATSRDLHIDVEEKNPWTNLKLNNDPSEFRFAVVSDRTGGHRPQVFSKAIERLNLLQPEFVLSVG